MDVQTAIKQINQGQVAPFYLVKGGDFYLQNQLLTALRKQVVHDEMGEIRFDLNEVPIDAVVAEAETVSFFADDKLLIVDHSYILTSERQPKEIDQDVTRLLNYTNQPTPGTTIVFLVEGKLDERKKVVKALKKAGCVIDAEPLSEKEVRQYIRQTIDNDGYTIQPKALDYLLELTNYDLTGAMAELKKIYLYAIAKEKKITYGMVDELVSKSLEHSLFGMTDYVLNNQKGKALDFYHDLLLQGEDTIKINYILAMQFRLLLQVKILSQRGYNQKAIADTLKVHPYRVKLALQKAGQMSVQRIGEIYNQFVEADYAMKTSQLDQQLIFEFLILKIAV